MKWFCLQDADIRLIAHWLFTCFRATEWWSPVCRTMGTLFLSFPAVAALRSLQHSVCLARSVWLSGKAPAGPWIEKLQPERLLVTIPQLLTSGVAFQLPWNSLWISVLCLWAPHTSLPSQSSLKHWFHALWACCFPCLYLCTCDLTSKYMPSQRTPFCRFQDSEELKVL